uniref:Uncharacterized protein n=1 Tax=Glossina austeni TaxID=7395 RepID=A0A1A9UN28_GLOAU
MNHFIRHANISLQSDPDNLTLNRKNSENILLNAYAAEARWRPERDSHDLSMQEDRKADILNSVVHYSATEQHDVKKQLTDARGQKGGHTYFGNSLQRYRAT